VAHLYSEADIELEDVQTAYQDFLRQVGQAPAEDEPYLKNVFQQGLVRTWIELALALLPNNVMPKVAADMLVRCFAKLVFDTDQGYLSLEKPYTARVLYRGNNINVKTGWAKDAWRDIILVSFLHEPTRKELRKALAEAGVSGDGLKEILSYVEERGTEALSDYLSRFQTQTWNDTKRNYADLGYGQTKIRQLRRLEESDDPEKQKEFKAEIVALTKERMQPGLEALANGLDVPLGKITKQLP
jgi:hypothetical protein